MSATAIFVAGVFTFLLIAFFVYFTVHELRKATELGTAPSGAGTSPAAPAAERAPPAVRALKILVATDGSECSLRAVEAVATRPWPSASEVEILTVVHTNVPLIPEPTMTGTAAYVTALEEDRQQAPERIRAAERCFARPSGLGITSNILEGDPQKVILDEAERWRADLIVVGSHGHGAMKRLVLGPVANGVALHAHCSVEIVRCPEARAGGAKAS